MTKESCIVYPAQSALIIIREPLMAICQIPVTNKEGEKVIAPDPQAAAAILSQFIFWTDGKISNKHQKRYHAAAAATENEEDQQDHSLWIYKNYDELKLDLLDLFGRNKIIENVQWLVLADYLKCRTNPRYRWDKTLQYSVNIEHVQSQIHAAPSFIFKPSSIPNQTIEKGKNKRAIPEKTTEGTTEDKKPLASNDAGDQSSFSKGDEQKTEHAEKAKSKTKPPKRPPSSALPPQEKSILHLLVDDRWSNSRGKITDPQGQSRRLIPALMGTSKTPEYRVLPAASEDEIMAFSIWYRETHQNTSLPMEGKLASWFGQFRGLADYARRVKEAAYYVEKIYHTAPPPPEPEREILSMDDPRAVAAYATMDELIRRAEAGL